VRTFSSELLSFDPRLAADGGIDFKYIDAMPLDRAFKDLKVIAPYGIELRVRDGFSYCYHVHTTIGAKHKSFVLLIAERLQSFFSLFASSSSFSLIVTL